VERQNINDTDHINLLPETYTNDIKLKSRNNSDKEINEQGNNLIDLCIETKLRILNGRIDGDSLGYRTYYSPRGSSTVNRTEMNQNYQKHIIDYLDHFMTAYYYTFLHCR
jgi:hypothetical protein